jgi:hypothetical protein
VSTVRAFRLERLSEVDEVPECQRAAYDAGMQPQRDR